MKSEINLYVYAVFPDSEYVQAGRILSRNFEAPGNREGFFKYSAEYLSHPKAFALDPEHLPLDDKVYSANNGETGVHAIFEDSLPDAWGRQILARKGGMEQTRYAPAHLLSIIRGGALGRFLYNEQARKPAFPDTNIAFSKISEALAEADRLEESIDTDTAELQHLLACGSSAGGARPKVLTKKDKQLWIAKFASRNDIHPELFVSLEHAGLTLAALAGLQIQSFHKEQVGSRSILLIKRFDVTEQKGRNAIISFKTLTGIYDQYEVSYSDLAGFIRKYSYQPEKDLELLYRQMIVNVLLVNTDDHLQNFAMLNTNKGWELSPAYDIVPNIYQTEQILKINNKHSGINAADIIAEGRNFGLSAHKSRVILEDVAKKTTPWEEIFRSCSVPEAHTGRLRENIRNRHKTLSMGQT